VPEGFAHGFLVLSDEAEFTYKCTDFYDPEDEGGVLWNDSDIGIEWPIVDVDEILLSEKDKQWKTLNKTTTDF
jgi:dTDP-4-dehydrorhamnose 3,5-epimerase